MTAKTILTTLFLSAAMLLGAEEWYRHSAAKGIEIISRAEAGQPNFQDKRIGKNDDYLVIDFLDSHFKPARVTNVQEENGDLHADLKIELADGKSVTGRISSKVTELTGQKILWEFSLKFPEAVSLPRCYFGIGMNEAMLGRVIQLGGETVAPDAGAEGTVKHGPWGQPTGAVRIPLNRGELIVTKFPYPGKKHSSSVLKYGKKWTHVRLWAAYDPVTELKWSAEIEYRPWKSEPISLRNAVNMGLADDVANDGKGGWTDQGPDNDLRVFPVGRHQYGPAVFDVIDPATNQGKAAMVFANPSRGAMLREVTVPVGGKRYDYLYLLHCTAWSSDKHVAGTIDVRYSDGSEQKITVRDQRDVSNWWSVQNAENAPCVWNSENFFSIIGMFMTRFPVDPDKGIESLVFRTGNQSVWCVLGVSGVSGKNIPFAFQVDKETPMVIEDGKKWKKFNYTYNPFYIKDSSAVDFSFLSGNQPAGTHGKLQIQGDKFVFEKQPGQPVRFWGANITGDGNMMKDRELEIVPKLLKQLGYNAVRLHHFDELLMKKGPEFKFDEEKLDRFFKTFAAFKKAGLYVTLDLFTSRVSGFEEMHGKSVHYYKILSWYHPDVRRNMERFSEKILATPNPYTGMTMAEDPALISVGLINENPRLHVHAEHKYPNNLKFWNDLYKPLFDAWCAENGIAQTDRPSASLWARFQIENHIKAFDHYKKFLRELGVTVPVSDVSNRQFLLLAGIRNHFDYADIHWYFDHPTVAPGFKPPYEYTNQSSLTELHLSPLASIAARILGKPGMLTEWHFCAPNQYRAEGGAVGGAYAALNGIRGIFDFNPYNWDYKWGEPFNSDNHPVGMFSTYADPINFYNAIMTAMLFLRGDVKEADREFILRVRPDLYTDPNALLYSNHNQQWMAAPLPSYTVFGAVGKIGIEVSSAKGGTDVFDNNELLKDYQSKDPFRELRKQGFMKDGAITSSTGEITAVPAKKQLKVVTPRSEALVQEGAAQKGNLLSVSENSTFSNVFAGALDEEPLLTSRRILLIHTTNVMPSSEYTLYRGKMRLGRMGHTPYFMRRGSVNISLKNQAAGTPKLYALDMHGNRIAEIPFTVKDDVITFTADNDLGRHCPMAYELIRP